LTVAGANEMLKSGPGVTFTPSTPTAVEGA
jgi:hypothetical protein